MVRLLEMNYIKRNLEKVVSQVTKEYPVVLVTGPRQVGKSRRAFAYIIVAGGNIRR